jgi:hypothetical protein
MAKYSLKKLRRYVSAETTQIDIALCLDAPSVRHHYSDVSEVLQATYLRMVQGLAEANITEMLSIALPTLKAEIKHVSGAEKLVIVDLHDRPNSTNVREIGQANALAVFCSELARLAAKDAFNFAYQLHTAMVGRS